MSDIGTISFGRQLLRQRRRAGLTQERLAQLAGVGLRTLRDIEAGATTYPQMETARRLCEALRLPPDEHTALLAMLRTTPRRRPPHHMAAPAPLRAPLVLPLPLTAVIGREREIEALTQLLRHACDGAATRLLTVTGPGGVGKTRLALEVASRLRDAFVDGVALVELASLGDATLVLATLAHTLGLRESGQQPLHEALHLHLYAQELLLILDNFEQVAPAGLQVVALLSGCPRVTALVTSRASLRVRGEQVFELQPLELPSATQPAQLDTMSHYPAVNLFVQRARAVVPGFTLDATNAPAVAELCRRVDGLPLAIELAAPWVNVLPPTALLARLERSHDGAYLGAEPTLELLVDGALDLPARQRTMHATMAWSYNLLNAREQELFRRLSVFVGGCTLDAAVAVHGRAQTPGAIPAREAEVLAGLAALARQSLLRLERQGEATRVEMLRTIQEFGLACLAKTGELAGLRRAHALYYLTLAEQAETQLTGPRQDTWIERLTREHDNLRAALCWAMESAETEVGHSRAEATEPAKERSTLTERSEVGMRLAGALWRFWYISGYLSEGRGWLERLLARQASPADAFARAKALNGAGVLAHFQGDYEHAAKLHTESLELRRRLGSKADVAGSLNNLALVARQQGQYQHAADLLTECLALRRDLGDRWGTCIALGNLASVALDLGDHERAAVLYEESLGLSRALEDSGSTANTLAGLALVAQYRGDYERMTALSEESVALARKMGDKTSLAYALSNLALARHLRGDETEAGALFRQSLDLYWTMGNKVGVATCLDGLADVAVALGQAERAARLLSAAAHLRAAIGSPVRLSAQERHERCVATVRAALGDDAFAAAWAIGQALDLSEVIAGCYDAAGAT